MLKSRTFKNIEKGVSLVSAYFLLAVQPVWADPAIIQDKLTQDPKNQAGFVDATKAEQSYQNQLTEVQRMQAQLNDPATNNPNAADPISILTKFQTPDQKTNQTLTQATTDATKVSQSLATQKLNSQVDVAMLKMQLSPEVSPIFVEPTAVAAAVPSAPNSVPSVQGTSSQNQNLDALQQVSSQDQLSNVQNKIKAVPIAEMGYTGTMVVSGQNSSTVNKQQDPTVLAQQTAQLTQTQQTTSTTNSTAAPSIQSMITESPSLAGMTDGTPQPAAETAPPETQLASTVPAAPTATTNSGTAAMEMAALMNADTTLAPSPTTQIMDVQNYSLMGALTPQMQVSSQSSTIALPPTTTTPTPQDPPMFIFPIPEPTSPFVFPVQPAPLLPGQKPPGNVSGGEALFGKLLDAIRSMLFADNNLGNGKVIGNGVNDKAEMLSNFMVMYFKFFGFNFNANELRNLFLKGTTKDGMELFGINDGSTPPVIPLVMLFSAYVLETSLFFPIKGAKGLSNSDLAGANKIQLPIILPNDLLVSLGHFLDPSLTTDAQKNAAGRSAAAAAIMNFFNITLSVMVPTDGKPIKFLDPNHPDAQPFAVGSKQALNLKLPPGALQFNFFKDLAPAVSASLLPLLQALDGTNTGMFGVLTIDLSSIMNQIGKYMVRSLQDQLGPMLQYYNSLGSPTGLKPGLPVPSLPLLLMLGFNFPAGAGTDPSVFNNPLFFAQTLAIPLLFSLSTPPIPSLYDPNPDTVSQWNKNVDKLSQNAQQNFEDQAKAKVAEKTGLSLSKIEKITAKPTKDKGKKKKK